MSVEFEIVKASESEFQFFRNGELFTWYRYTGDDVEALADESVGLCYDDNGDLEDYRFLLLGYEIDSGKTYYALFTDEESTYLFSTVPYTYSAGTKTA